MHPVTGYEGCYLESGVDEKGWTSFCMTSTVTSGYFVTLLVFFYLTWAKQFNS